jgi:hypothetical protein
MFAALVRPHPDRRARDGSPSIRPAPGASGPRGAHPASRATRAGLVLLLGLVVAGCGYSLAGRGAFLPDYIQAIGVPLFTNSTTVFDVEQVLTQHVRQEFIGRGNYRVVPEAAGVDAVLTGNVNSISIAPAAFNEEQQATRYAVVVVMRLEFRDLRGNSVLWENPSLVFREEYDLASGDAALDVNAFFGQEANAMERLAENFAESVVSSILEAF